MEEMIKIYRN